MICGLMWQIAASDNPGILADDMKDVVAITPHDVWAVGSEDDGGGSRTLTEHWDGGAWVTIPESKY